MKICAIAYFSIARPALARPLRDTEASIGSTNTSPRMISLTHLSILLAN
jgi:hypothetical protein